MNTRNSDQSMDDFELRRALRNLAAGRTPDRDLWPGIAARLGEPLRATAPVAGARTRWPLLLGMAASLLVAVLLALPLLPGTPPQDSPPPALVAQEPAPALADPQASSPSPSPSPSPVRAIQHPSLLQADALTLEYAAVLQQFEGAQLPPALRPALADLDGSAREIRAALRQDPQSDFLLGQLRRTYAQRLHVTRLALAG